MSFSGPGGMAGASETLAYMIRAYDMASPVFKAFGKQVDAVTKQVQVSMAEMNKALATYDRAVATSAGQQKAALGSMAKAQSDTAKSAVSAADAEISASRRSAAATNEQAAASERAAARQRKAADETVAAATRSSGSLQRMGRDILLGGAAVVGATVDMAAHFQANTLRMQTQAGATAQGLDQIRTGLLKMAGEVGATPNQLANGMYHVVSAMNAVLPPATRVSQELAIMKIAAEGAQVGHSNLEETTYALSSALNALHMQAKDAGTVMGQLNAIVGTGDMTMQDLVDSFKSGLIPAANTFGLSLQSVGAALAVMGDMGMRGALAGTRLRMAISLMAAPTKQAAGILETLGLKSNEAMSTSEAMSAALRKAGVTTTQLSYDLKQPDGLQVALVDLKKHMEAGGLSSTAAGAAISRAFGGGRMGAAIQLLAENTDRLNQKFVAIGDTGANFGSAWQKTSQTFRVQVDKAVAALEALGIKIGNVLLPYVTSALHGLESMANWLAKNQIVLEALGAAFVAFASVAIGTYFVGKIRSAIGLMQDFGSVVARSGRWLFGMGGPGAGGPAGPAGGPLGGAGGTPLTGLFGYMGSPLRVGTMMNPLAVVLSKASLGSSSTAMQTTSVAPAASAESKAAQAQTQATMERMTAQEAAMSSATRAASAQSEATLERMLAQQAATGTQLSLLAGDEVRMEAGVARLGEQLSLGGIATTEKSMPIIAQPRQLPGVIGSDPFVGMSAEQRFAMANPGGRFGAPASELGAVGPTMASSIRSSIGSALNGLMRGGLIATLGVSIAQMLGDAIGGGAGSAIKKIGTGAAIGGGLGAVFGPWGAALGAALGAGVGGLVSSGLFDSQGVKAAKDFTKGFGGAGRAQLQHDVAHWIDDANKQIAGTNLDPAAVALRRNQAASQPPRQQPVHTRFGDVPGPQTEPTPRLPSPSPAQLAQAQQDWFEAGNKIAKNLEAGWNQYKFQDEPTMVKQLRAELGKKVPVQSRAWAIESMITYAQGLEQSGRLPKGATAQMIAQMRSQFPGFERYLGLTANASAATFAANFKLKTVQDQTKTALTAMEGDFSGVREAMINTSGTVADKSAAVVKALMSIVQGPNSSAGMRAQAKHDLDVLRDATNSDFSAMADATASKVSDMRARVGNDIGAATKFAGSAMDNFASNVWHAMNSGQLSTGQAMDQIAKETNKILGQFGQAPLSQVQVQGLAQLSSGVQAFSSAHGGIGGGAETGGWIGRPGEVGRDQVPIVVGRGEAVLKGQDQKIVNSVLAHSPWGSLGGVFAATAGQKHWQGMDTGGYVYPLPPGTSIGRTDQGIDASMPVGSPIGPVGAARVMGINPGWYKGQPYMWWQLLGGPDAGQQIYLAEQIQPLASPGQVVPANQAMARFASSGTGIEMGWAASGGRTLAQATTGYHEGQVTPAGSSFRAFLAGLSHGVITGGGAGAIQQITAPHILGKGKLAEVSQAAVNKATAAANDHISKIMAQMTVGSGTFTGGSTVPVGNILQIAQQAFQAAGLPFVAFIVEQLLSKESSGGQNLPASGSLGATGPFQVIPSTFRQYDPGGNIMNPYDNSLAAARYIKSRYGSLEHMAAVTGLFGGGYHGYAGGGFVDPSLDALIGRQPHKVSYAGGFAEGGSFTTRGPTLALFGEGGIPETVMAFQGGGLVPNDRSSVSYHTGPKGTSTTTTSSSSVIEGGQKVTTTHRTTTGPSGTSETTTVSSTPYHPPKPPKPPRPHVDHFHWAYNPLSGQIEYHDTAQWQLIHANEAKQKAQASAAKKAYAAYLAQTVTDPLRIGGQSVGDIQQSRGSLMGEHLPLGSPINLLGNLNKVSDAGFKKIESSLNAFLKIATVKQDVGLADTFARRMSRTGPDHPLFQQIWGLTTKVDQLNKRAENRQAQADRLHKLALTEHGHQRQKTMDKAHQDHVEAQKLRHQAVVAQNKIAALDTKIANSRTAQLGNAIIGAALKGVTSEFTGQQAVFQHSDTIAQLLEGVAPGSTAKSLGLSDAQLKGAGLTRARVRALAGAASGPAALVDQVGELTKSVIPQYQQDATRLTHLYHDALKTHNKKLQESLLKQLDAVTQAQLKAYGDLQTAQTNLVEQTYQEAQAKASGQQASSDILGAIQNLAPGTSLAGLGLSDSVLKGLGVDPSRASALEGSSLTFLQDLQGKQGDKLTAAQIAAAQAGTQAQNQILAAQRATDISTLSDLQQQLPTLRGSAHDAAVTHITDLTKSVLSLTDEMNKNTDAVNKLTTATNSNTTATGQMTGQVSYTYNGQGYLAGVGLSSDTGINMGLGL